MGGLFSKPKTPEIKPVQPIPEPDDALKQVNQRRKQAKRAMQQGIMSTRLSDANTQDTMQNKPVGQ